jgi:uncharacterized protein YbjT (DUF2867 family)
MTFKHSIVFLGATGAVGTVALNALLEQKEISRIVLLGRKTNPVSASFAIDQHIIDIFHPSSYLPFIHDVETAICTLGVGEPSKVNKDEFIKTDKTAVLNFAKACKEKGVKHFQLLSSIGINSKSSVFYLRTKGELVDDLIKLNFERLSIFQPSLIITPENRYGFTQAVVLKVWPKLNFLLVGRWRKYRGIKIDMLGKAIANNIKKKGEKVECLEYDQIRTLCEDVI